MTTETAECGLGRLFDGDELGPITGAVVPDMPDGGRITAGEFDVKRAELIQAHTENKGVRGRNLATLYPSESAYYKAFLDGREIPFDEARNETYEAQQAEESTQEPAEEEGDQDLAVEGKDQSPCPGEERPTDDSRPADGEEDEGAA